MADANIWHFCGLDANCWITASYDWQTMIGGAVAIAAAWAAYRAAMLQVRVAKEQGAAQATQAGEAYAAAMKQVEMAQKQLDAQQAQADRERAGKVRAARAFLPLALSELCDVLELSVSILKKSLPLSHSVYPGQQNPNETLKFEHDVPPVPEQSTLVLERMIEFLEDNAVSGLMEEILRDLQIFKARWRSNRQVGYIAYFDLCERIAECAIIHTKCCSLFPYSRAGEDVPDHGWQDRLDESLMTLKVGDMALVAEAAYRDGGASGKGIGITLGR